MSTKYDVLAPCGVYCGACPSYGKSCLGCASENRNQKRSSKWGCKIRNCCYGLEKNFCFHCEQFPCKIFSKKLLSVHLDDPSFAYRFELPVMLPVLKDLKVDEYLSFHNKRWKCDCGGVIRFYTYECDTCGKRQFLDYRIQFKS